MKIAKKNIGSLTFKWKQKIKGNICSYANKEGERERERCRDMLNWNVKNHYGNRKMKKEEREHRFFRFMGLWKGEKT